MKIKCSENETLFSSQDLIFKKKKTFEMVECDDLRYRLIEIQGADGARGYSLEIDDKTGTRVNQIRFDMKTAWEITLPLKNLIYEEPELKRNAHD